MLRIIGFLMSAGALLGGGVAHGAAPGSSPNPSLFARERGVDDSAADPRSLDIEDLAVRVEIVGNVAQTTVTAKFKNLDNDDLEGTFALQLPDGAVVSGYALDIEGHMIDGVLAPPIKARRAYEEKVRAGIDPGVAEVRRGNVFSTRVYPILAGRGRTVRLTFVTPLRAQQGFTLPLLTRRAVARVSLSVLVRDADKSPNVVWPAGVKSEWRNANGALANDITLNNQKLAGALHVDAPETNGNAFVTRHPSGQQFVELRDAVAELEAAAIPRSARVYWDRSLSRRDDRLGDELATLEQYFSAAGLSHIEVVSFASSGASARQVDGATQAANLIRDLDYRGATSFDVLSRAGGGAGKVDICLMFTDGISTIDARPELDLGCPLYIITSAPDADLGYLELLARRNGGTVLRLGARNVGEVVQQLRWRVPRVVGVRDADGAALAFAPLPASARGWALVAQAPDSDEIVVRIAGLAAHVVERRYRIGDGLGRFAGTGALWAQDRVSQIVGDGRRQEELEQLSWRYSVASPAMSFIVFERADDYVAANIEPPRSYPKEWLVDYRDEKREADEEAVHRRDEWLEELVAAWNEQKSWWAYDFRRNARPKVEKRSGPAIDAITAEDVGRFPDANAAEALHRQARSRAGAPQAESREQAEEVIVTGLRSSLNYSVQANAAGAGEARSKTDITVELARWNPDRPYLRALDAASRADFERVFESLSRTRGAMPVFWFDVAEWLHRKQRTADAIDVLLSALELPARDTETIALVADRLMRYGQPDRAIWLYEEVVRLDPDRPQPARTLALALGQRAQALNARASRKDLARAFELLTRVAMMPPADEYDGIELIALMDANGIIPRLRALGERDFDLDARLIAALDVDLRVVIEWNTGATDMDLWVDQPDGERSIFSNPRTAIGGRLSNDMTEGYGPEEYLLRRAIDGEYAIRVNVYASDALNPNGATMVTAHLTRNFGRADQSTETMELELMPDDEGEKLVGRFKVQVVPGKESREKKMGTFLISPPRGQKGSDLSAQRIG